MKPAFIVTVSLLAALVLLVPKPDLSVAATDEWTQFGHDPGHTNSTTEFIPGPWHYVWQWNGANSSGQPQSGHLDVGNLVQPVTGGGLVYMATSGELVALSPTDGHVVWSRSDLGSLSATPAYDAGFLYVTSGNGTLYQLDAPSGATNQTFVASAALDLAPLLVGSTVYVGDANGVLYAINTATMTEDWSYSGNSPSSTPPAYSALHNTLVYLTKDLNVHAVDASNGSAKWVVKPTPRSYQCLTNQSSDPCNVINSSGAQAENGWPVIADAHGLVFVRYRLDWNTLWTWSPFPNTNTAIRSNFQSQPGQQPLYALNIDTGAQAFIPAAGNGGDGDGGYLQMGPQPVVTTQGGQEVAYVNWRNGQLDPHSNGNDGRGDDHTGEMVLDSSTVSGYAPGDLRFVSYQFFPTDEMRQLTMAGNTLFYAHWLVEAAQTITNRASNLGNSPSNPIATSNEAFTIWREGPSGSQPCTFDSATRYCPNGLFSFGDTRSYPPGFYEYFNSQNGGSIAATIESNGLVLIKTDDGGLMALAGTGGPPPTPTPSTPTATPTATNTPLTTNTPTITATDTPTPAPATSTPTSTPTGLPTSTPTNTPVSTFTPTPIPGSFTASINNSADDVNQDGTSFTSNSSTVWLGTGQSTTSSYLGLRFNNVQVPKGATITSARLSVFTTTQQWLTISFSIAGDATGNSAAFSSSSLPSARPLTNTHVSHSDNVRWNANTWNVLDQSASVVQEIVNRSDWQSGNSLSMILKGTGGSWGRKFVTAFDGNPANAPQLTITYH